MLNEDAVGYPSLAIGCPLLSAGWKRRSWHRKRGRGRPTKVLRRTLKQFIAVVAGNVVYFFLLLPRLPVKAQHRPFHIDLGLLVDVWLCAVVYGLIELLDRKRAPSK